MGGLIYYQKGSSVRTAETPDAGTDFEKAGYSRVNYDPDGRRTVISDDASGDATRDAYYQGLYRSPEDAQKQTEQVKTDFASRLQDQIDAINGSYASVYERASQEGASRLGSTNVINALKGQRGSASGTANVDKTRDYNSEIMGAIDAKKNAEIAGIRGKYDQMLDNELKYQEDLRRSDADKYMKYLEGRDEKVKEIKRNRLDDMRATNISFDQLDEDLQKEYAEMYGYGLAESRRSWDHKVAQQLIEKEQAETARKRDDEQYGWQKEDRENADVAAENELRSRGWEYVPNVNDLTKIDKSQYEIVAVKQPGGKPDKLYKVPKGMSELELYEAKKAIDAKYRAGSGGDESSLSDDEQAFFKDVDAMLDDLSGGKRDWGSAWNFIKSKWAVPDSENATIDNLLNKDKWSKGGAYEEQLENRKGIENDAFLEWLNSRQ